jgi:peroxiredoxin
MTQGYLDLPPDLPVPNDDGACDHLRGLAMPSIVLPATDGSSIDLGCLAAPRTVIYCYPRTGVPGEKLPNGWDMIPGARGCTPQSCGFRDHHAELAAHRCAVYGLSAQSTCYQREMALRLNLPFAVLSDAEFRLTDALRLPSFEIDGMRLIKRLTLVVRGGSVETCFYPIFPPDGSAEQVLRWLESHPL